jgi:hypothetical protein
MLETLISCRRDWLPLLRLRVRLCGGEPRGFFSRSNTEICIEGYPRSANSFAVRMFRQANDLHVAHHTHAIANIRAALRQNVPVICLIRSPLAAICSNLIYSGSSNVAQEIADYRRFYEFAEKESRAVLFAKFETVTNDFELLILAANKRFGACYRHVGGHNKAAKMVQRDIEEAYKLLSDEGNLRSDRIPIPRKVRSLTRQRWEPSVRADKGFNRISELYERIVTSAPCIV